MTKLFTNSSRGRGAPQDLDAKSALSVVVNEALLPFLPRELCQLVIVYREVQFEKELLDIVLSRTNFAVPLSSLNLGFTAFEQTALVKRFSLSTDNILRLRKKQRHRRKRKTPRGDGWVNLLLNRSLVSEGVQGFRICCRFHANHTITEAEISNSYTNQYPNVWGVISCLKVVIDHQFPNHDEQLIRVVTSGAGEYDEQGLLPLRVDVYLQI